MKRNASPTALFLTLMFFVASLHAQVVVNKAYQDTTGNPQDTLSLSFIAKDGTSNLIMLGNTWPTSDSEQILITKYNYALTQIWQVRIPSPSTKRFIATNVDLSGGYIYVCATPIDSVNNKSTFVTYKMSDSTGAILWAKQYTPSYAGYAIPAAIREDTAGNVYVSGTEQVSSTNYEMTFLKYNSSGTLQFSTHYDSAGLYSGAVGMGTVDAKNTSFPVTGYSGSTFGTWDIVSMQVNISTGAVSSVSRVGNGSGSFISHPVALAKDNSGDTYIVGASEISGPNIDIKIIKYDSLFNQLWVKTWGGPDSLDDEPSYMVSDALHNVITTGYTTHANGQVDLLVVKYDKNGNFKWSKTVNPPNTSALHYAIGNSIVTDANNTIYVTGKFYNGSTYDMLTLSLDTSGKVLWEKTYDGGFSESGNNISLDNSGNVYVAGVIIGTTTKYVALQYTSTTIAQTVVNKGSMPYYVDNQMIIKFAPSEITKSYVDNTELQYFSLAKLVQDTALLNKMLSKTGINFSQATAVKMFQRFHSYDTLSISRLADTVNMGSYWTMFLISHAKSANTGTEEAWADSLNTIGSKIEFAEPNMIALLNSTPNDSLFSLQNSLYPSNTSYDSAHINCSPAWNVQKGNNGIKVGIYDSGIKWDHSDFSLDGSNTLSGSVVIGGWNWAGSKDISASADNVGHGTACAGIVGALSDNHHGVAGIAGGDIVNGKTGCQLFDMQIADSVSGNSQAFIFESQMMPAIIEGSYYHPGANPTGYGLHIINASWGEAGSQWANGMTIALRTAFENKVTFVTSRGNLASFSVTDSDIQYPACVRDEWVISVGGTGTNGQWKQNGNGLVGDTSDNGGIALIGAGVDVAAPATKALVTTVSNVQNAYTTFNGTSSAAPHVAGLAALMMAEQNVNGQYASQNLAPDDVQFLIKRYAKGYPTYDSKVGYGLIDAGNVMQHLDYPKYRVVHSGTPSVTGTALISSGTEIDIPIAIGQLSGGIYFADVWRVSESYSNTFPSTTTILNAWPRLSSTTGYQQNGTVYDNPWESFSATISGNTASVSCATYAYHVTQDILGHTLDYWIPNTLSNCHGAYSLHTFDSTLTEVSAVAQNAEDNFSIYPNPSMDNVHVSYSVSTVSDAVLQIMDVSGKLVQSYDFGKQNAGSYTNSIDVSRLSQGLYICTMVIGTERIEKKLVKLR